MKAYPEYKASGIDWLGEIPSHWRVMPLKYTVNNPDTDFIDGDWIESVNISESGIRYLTSGNVGDGVYKEQGCGFITEETFQKLKCTEVFSGDLLISRLNEPIARTCEVPLMDFRIVTCVDNVIYRPKQSFFFKHFMLYQLNSLQFRENATGLSSGSTMKRISRSKLGNIRIIVPSLEEQETIAAYLDDKTAKIDALVAEKQSQVEDLRKYRTSLITETVTRGLNPDAPLRSSGIDWIGNIPKRWSISKFKFSLREIKDGTHFSPDTTTDGYSYVTATDVRGIGINYENTKKVSLDDFTKLVQSGCEIYKDDVLLVKDGATTGRVGMKDDDTPAVTLSSVAMLRTKSDSDPKFLFYFLQSSIIQNQISIAMAGAAMPRITLEKLGKFIALIPPYDEQKQIVKYLDDKTAKIDALIDELNKQLEELALYRKAVISEAVTGKVDVRDWKPED